MKLLLVPNVITLKFKLFSYYRRLVQNIKYIIGPKYFEKILNNITKPVTLVCFLSIAYFLM